MALAFIGTAIVVPSASAAIQLGDSNQDGGISPSDAYWIYMYLNGSITATRQQLTAMDVNQDGVIDTSDATTIMYNLANIKPFGTLYTVPDNATKTYHKHDCSSTNMKQYTTYTINSTNDKPTGYNTYSDFTTPDILDKENIGCVKLTYMDNNNEINLGSGFVIDDHIIATAAHVSIILTLHLLLMELKYSYFT